jgi:hypothetical protein
MILGATDQKVWVFEVFRQTLGKAGMCWSQPAGVDHMPKKRKAGGIFKKLHRLRFRHPSAAGGRPLVTG